MGSSCSNLLRRGVGDPDDSLSGSPPEEGAGGAAGDVFGFPSARLTGVQGVPTLAELCVDRVACLIAAGRLGPPPGAGAGSAGPLAGVPRELVQCIFVALAERRQLTAATLELVSAADNVGLSGYPQLCDEWLAMLGRRFTGLTRLDLSHCVEITDAGVASIGGVITLRHLNLDACLRIGDAAMESVSPLSRLLSLSVAGCPRVTDAGVACLACLPALTDLSCEQLPRLTDRGVRALASRATRLTGLNLGWTKVQDDGVMSLHGLPDLRKIVLSACPISDVGVAAACAMGAQLTHLRLSHCAACSADGLAFLSRLTRLQRLDLSQCEVVMDETLASLQGLTGLSRLLLAHTPISDLGVAHLSGLVRLRLLVLDSCHVTNAGLASLAGLTGLQHLDLSDTAVTSSGLAHVARMSGLTSLNLFSTGVSDLGVGHVTSLVRLTSLNLDSRLITDACLACLTSLDDLLELDLFGARVTAAGAVFIGTRTRLTSLESCGGGLTDAAMEALQDLTRLCKLNISQNELITDRSAPVLARFVCLGSLNLARTGITHHGALHLTSLSCLTSLCLSGCRINSATIAVLQAMPRMLYMTAEPP